jgi:O-acetylhomoserine/O-acetylserine sulfhydrylase-like pyridoxal-dependent enzyme
MAARRIDIQAIHAGQESPDLTTGARAVPIYQTTSKSTLDKMLGIM